MVIKSYIDEVYNSFERQLTKQDNESLLKFKQPLLFISVASFFFFLWESRLRTIALQANLQQGPLCLWLGMWSLEVWF